MVKLQAKFCPFSVLDIIEMEIVNKWGEYKGDRVIIDGDPILAPHDKPEPDYIIFCSRPVHEGIYQATLARGYCMKTYYTTEEEFSFNPKKEFVIRYQFPKIGVIQIIPNLTQGYLINKSGGDNIVEMKVDSRNKPLEMVLGALTVDQS